MNYKMTGRFIAQILLLEALFMIPAMFISLYCGENASVKAFLVTMVLLLVVSCLLRFLCKGAKSNFYATDGMVCVALSWIVLSLAGSLPSCSPVRSPNLSMRFLKSSPALPPPALPS